MQMTARQIKEKSRQAAQKLRVSILAVGVVASMPKCCGVAKSEKKERGESLTALPRLNTRAMDDKDLFWTPNSKGVR